MSDGGPIPFPRAGAAPETRPRGRQDPTERGLPAAFNTEGAAWYVGLGLTAFKDAVAAGVFRRRKHNTRNVFLRADLDDDLRRLPFG